MCDGVTFQAEAGKKGDSVGGVGVPTAGSLTAAEEKLLKACLGDADGDASNNLEVYNWDYGTANTTFHPHIVKIVKTPTAREDGGRRRRYDAGKYYLAYYGTPGTSNEPAQFMFAGLPPTGADLSIFDRRHGHALGNADVGAGGSGDSTDHEPRNQALTARFAKYGTTVRRPTCRATRPTGGKKGHLNASTRATRSSSSTRPSGRLDEGGARVGDRLHRRHGQQHRRQGRRGRPERSTPTRTATTSSWTRPSTGTAPRRTRKDFGIGGGPTGWTLGPISQGQFDGMASPGDQKIGTVPVVKFEPGPTSYEFVSSARAAASATATTAARVPRTHERQLRPAVRLPSRRTAPPPGPPAPLPGHDAKRTRIHLLVSLPRGVPLTGDTYATKYKNWPASRRRERRRGSWRAGARRQRPRPFPGLSARRGCRARRLRVCAKPCPATDPVGASKQARIAIRRTRGRRCPPSARGRSPGRVTDARRGRQVSSARDRVEINRLGCDVDGVGRAKFDFHSARDELEFGNIAQPRSRNPA